MEAKTMSNMVKSRPSWRRLVVSFAILMSPAMAAAAPIELSAAQWAALTAALPQTVVDFESLALGAHASPLILANGTYTAPAPFVSDLATFCGAAGDRCLLEGTSNFHNPRVFSGLPAGTRFWAAMDFFSINPVDGDIFRVTVVGNSGVSIFTHPLADGFVGYTDPTGLLTVTFEILGEGSPGAGIFNYSLDDVTTAATTAVPEPLSVLLVGTGLLGWRRRSAKRRNEACFLPPCESAANREEPAAQQQQRRRLRYRGGRRARRLEGAHRDPVNGAGHDEEAAVREGRRVRPDGQDFTPGTRQDGQREVDRRA